MHYPPLGGDEGGGHYPYIEQYPKRYQYYLLFMSPLWGFVYDTFFTFIIVSVSPSLCASVFFFSFILSLFLVCL